MIEQTINEWLSNFKNKNSEEYHTHLATVIRNNDVISALYSYLDDINKYQGVSNNIMYLKLIL